MTHRAVAFTAKGRAEIVPVDPPGPPGPNAVAGPTLATLISPGTELAVGYGENTSFPLHPGYAATFRAEEVGERVEGIRSGDILFCMGPHRSFQSADASEVVKVPDGLPPERAVLARLMGVSMTTLMTAARPGDLVLVSGAGPVGYLASHVFRAAGYEVIAAEPDAARRESLRESGIERVFPVIPVEDPDVAGQVALVVECSGHEAAVLDACRAVRKRGEVVMVGVPWARRTDLSLHEILHAVFHRYVVLRSGWEWELPTHAADFRPQSIHGNFRTALRWLSEGRIPMGDRLTLVPSSEAPSAYERLHRGEFPGLFPVLDWIREG